MPLDAELAELASAAARSGQPPLTSLTPDEARSRVASGNRLCSGGPDVAVWPLLVRAGNRRIAAREYRPRSIERARVVVYFHGGGWVTGDLEYSDQLCRHLAHECASVVVSVDYRLAPENPYPAAVDDAWAALDWAARVYRTDDGLVVAGDSAGGNLAAACAIRARAEGGPPVDGQLLIYPVLDHDTSRQSYLENRDASPMGAAAMEWFWGHYLPEPPARSDVMASPVRVPSVEGLPPSVIVIAGHDPLRDEAEEFAARLMAAGVPTVALRYPSLGHGFLRMTGACSAARRALADVCGATVELFRTAARVRVGSTS